MPIGDFNPYTKESQLYSLRTKRTQRQRGNISDSVDRQLKQRSGGFCEVRKKCHGAVAVARCHTQGRRTIDDTTVDYLFHGCADCHTWMDETPEGIRFKRMVREIGTTEYLKGRNRIESQNRRRYVP